MQRIEDVENILGKAAFDEAAPAVVHIDRDERQTADPSACQHTATYHGLQEPVIAEHVEEQDERIAVAAVVGTHENRGDQQTDECDAEATLVFAEILQRTQSQITDEEREEHVLSGIVPCAGMDIVPGQFGDECEDEQVEAVFLSVVRVLEALHNQKSKDRERYSADAAEQEIIRDVVMSDGEQRLDKRRVQAQIIRRQMVDKH